MNKIVVTGATSFLGSNVIEELSKSNIVYALVNPLSTKLSSIPVSKNIIVIPIDMNEISTLPSIIENADSFIHFSWQGNNRIDRFDRSIQEKNISSTLESIKVASKIGCSEFIMVGSQAEYGLVDGIITEASPTNPLTEYGKAKLEISNKGMDLANELGIKYIHTRVFSVYGFKDHKWSLVNSCLNTFDNGGEIELGQCLHIWNYLYVKDLAKIFSLLVSNPNIGSEIINISGNDNRVLRKYVEEMYNLSYKKGTYKYVDRQDTPASMNSDISKLIKKTSYTPETSFETGINEVLSLKRKNDYV